jgi:hypothetical protein
MGFSVQKNEENSAIAHIGLSGLVPGPPGPRHAWAPAWLHSEAEQSPAVTVAETVDTNDVPPFEPDAPAAELPQKPVNDLPAPVLLDCCPDCAGPLDLSAFGVQTCRACRVTRWRWMGTWKTARMPDRLDGYPAGYLDPARGTISGCRVDMPKHPPWIEGNRNAPT